MKCEQISELLPDYLQGSLSPDQRHMVEARTQFAPGIGRIARRIGEPEAAAGEIGPGGDAGDGSNCRVGASPGSTDEFENLIRSATL